jgi:ABC-type amino acid transport substrate-binding protein
LKENYRQAEVVEFETELAALISTSFGTTDAVVLDIVNASHLMQVYGFPNLAIGPEFEFVWEMRFGVHRDSPELFLLLSEVVSKMDINDKNRELQSFVNTYIPQFSYLERYKRQPFCTDYGCSAFCALPYFHQSST